MASSRNPLRGLSPAPILPKSRKISSVKQFEGKFHEGLSRMSGEGRDGPIPITHVDHPLPASRLGSPERRPSAARDHLIQAVHYCTAGAQTSFVPHSTFHMPHSTFHVPHSTFSSLALPLRLDGVRSTRWTRLTAEPSPAGAAGPAGPADPAENQPAFRSSFGDSSSRAHPHVSARSPENVRMCRSRTRTRTCTCTRTRTPRDGGCRCRQLGQRPRICWESAEGHPSCPGPGQLAPFARRRSTESAIDRGPSSIVHHPWPLAHGCWTVGAGNWEQTGPPVGPAKSSGQTAGHGLQLGGSGLKRAAVSGAGQEQEQEQEQEQGQEPDWHSMPVPA